MVSLKHEKIAHIHGDMNSFIGGQRLEFFQEAVAKHNLDINESYLVDGTNFSREEGYVAMETLMALNDPPTAVFCASDLLAIGALEAIHDAGKKVPEDFSIIGFDGIDLGQLITPRLTTIKQNTYEMGRLAAVSMLSYLKQSSGAKKSKIVTVDTSLILGHTTDYLKH